MTNEVTKKLPFSPLMDCTNLMCSHSACVQHRPHSRQWSKVAQLFIEYLDDVVMFAVTFEEHLKCLEMVLKALCSVYLGLKAEKCHLGYEELKFLGHVVSADSVWPDPDKTSTVAACPVPSDHLAHHLIKLAWICLDPLPCQPMETSRL